MPQLIGIDLGATAARIARLKGGQPEALLNRDNLETTPSLVVPGSDGGFLTGAAAVTAVAANPELAVDPWRAPDALASLLGRLKSDAELRCGDSVEEVAIAFPDAGAEDRLATLHAACRLAGLSATPLEPAFAAAAGAGFREPANAPRAILVYDLGAAAFSAALLVLRGSQLTLLGNAQIQRLGGASFDQRLVDYVVSVARRQHSVDPESDRKFMAKLRKEAADAKIALSASAGADIVIAGMLGGGSVDVELSIDREEFDRLIADLAQQTIDASARMLDACGCRPRDVHHVVPVGASTATPLIRRLLGERFGAETIVAGDSTRWVVVGAALQTGARLVEFARGVPGAAAVFEPSPEPEPAEAAPKVAAPVDPEPPASEAPAPEHVPATAAEAAPERAPQYGAVASPVCLPPWDAIVSDGEAFRHFFGGAARLRIGGVWNLATPAVTQRPVVDHTRVYLADPRPQDLEITMTAPAGEFVALAPVPPEARPGDAVEVAFAVDLVTRVPYVTATFAVSGLPTLEVRAGQWTPCPNPVADHLPQAEPQPAAPAPAELPPEVAPARVCYARLKQLSGSSSYSSFLSRRGDEDALLLVFSKEDPRGRTAFLNSLLAMQVEHPSVLRVLDFGRAEDGEFVLAEYPGGESLRELMGHGRERQPVSPRLLLPLVMQVLEGLEQLHERHIFHRNIKPANIWLNQDGSRAVIADFQVATVLRTGDWTRHLSGTAPYMSREVLEGQADRRADLYALGVLLFEMLTGRLPFWSADQRQLVDQIVGQPAPEPRSINPGISKGLSEVVLRAIEKDPAKRFQTAAEFAEALASERAFALPGQSVERAVEV